MAAPSIPKTVTVDEYLHSSYRPDVDYLDGHLEERNLGELDHATIQSLLAAWFIVRDTEWGIRTRVELRVQVSESRFRVPDICVMRKGSPLEQIVRTAPLICIEILSPEDSVHKMRDRVADYLRMGVEHVWLLDPASREGFVCTATGWNQPADGALLVPGTQIKINLADLFSGLDVTE